MADIAAFSFYPGKNLGCYGEAGAITTNNDKIAQKIRVLRDHGARKKYHHEYVSGNFRMEALQGAVLSVKIQYLEKWTESRCVNAALYNKMLNNQTECILPWEAAENKHVYHLYVVRMAQRDNVIRRLAEAGIATGIHYPVPIHLQNAYQFLGYKTGDFPSAEKISSEILSLPMYPELKKSEITFVVRKLREIA